MCRPSNPAIGLIVLTVGVLIGAAMFARHAAERAPTSGVVLSTRTFSGHRYVVAQVDFSRAALSLHWKSPEGTPFRTFDALDAYLRASRRRLAFATNAGMFTPQRTPVGLHVEDGRELSPVNLGSGVGNFYIKPNGIFMVDADGARILDSAEYRETRADVRLATQSGPMLLVNGKPNPHFRPDSTNVQIRSAVAVRGPSDVYFVLSQEPVTFYELALLCRDALHCGQALYLDGAISRVFPGDAPQDSVPSDFVGILAVTVIEGPSDQSNNPPRPFAKGGKGR